jgi:anti-sigma factor RsiW
MSTACEACGPRLGALADGELDPHSAREVSAHVDACPDCAGRLEAIRSLSAAIGGQAPRYRAPDSLRASLRASVRGAAAALSVESDEPRRSTVAPSAPRGAPSGEPQRMARPYADDPEKVIPIARRHRIPQQWLAAAAAVAVLLAGTGRVAWMEGEASARRDEQAQEVLASHVRSLMGTHLTDVASTDQHTVKPWFDGRLDFAPPVYDLADQGFPLTGGRLDYAGGHPAAAMVYARRKHWINLFVWPAEGDGATEPAWQARRGYHMARWDAAGMRHWAVSDVSEGDLKTFVHLLREREPLAGSPAADGR